MTNHSMESKISYSTISRAVQGDEDALKAVLLFYRPYMHAVAACPTYDLQGLPSAPVDDDLLCRLETKLLLSVLRFKIR